MNLYQVQFDSETWFVEAESFAAAIELWKERAAIEWGDNYSQEDEPESVALVHDDGCVRQVTDVERLLLEAKAAAQAWCTCDSEDGRCPWHRAIDAAEGQEVENG